MDSCQGYDLEMPYTLMNDIFQLRLTLDLSLYQRNKIPPKDLFPLQEIVIIISSQPNEISMASSTGSIFSGIFFRELPKSKSWNILCDKINSTCRYLRHIQVSSVHSSYPDLGNIWPWLNSTERYVFRNNYLTDCLVVYNML